MEASKVEKSFCFDGHNNRVTRHARNPGIIRTMTKKISNKDGKALIIAHTPFFLKQLLLYIFVFPEAWATFSTIVHKRERFLYFRFLFSFSCWFLEV